MQEFEMPPLLEGAESYACGVAVSCKLGKVLKSQGKVIEVDTTALTEIAAQELAGPILQDSSIVIEKFDGFRGGSYRSSTPKEIKRQGRLPTHFLTVCVTKKEVTEGAASDHISQTTRHEARHAADYAQMGVKKAARRYKLYGLGIAYPTFLGTALGEFELNKLTHLSNSVLAVPNLYQFGLKASEAVVALYMGLILTAAFNPFEFRAYSAGAKTPKQEGLITFSDAAKD